jgi:uncharacterized membrane-anchored protein YhcB (DUF1043 family)
MSEFWFIALTFCAGAAVGALISVQICRGKESTRLKKELETLKEEYARYKENVGRHFVQTSTLVNNLTQSYKDVHQHLSNGAQSLCDADLAMELRKSTTPLIANAIDGVAEPAPEEPPVQASEHTPETETASAETESQAGTTEPAREAVSSPVEDEVVAVPQEPDVVAEEIPQTSQTQPAESLAAETETIEPKAGHEPEPEHASAGGTPSDDADSSSSTGKSEQEDEEEHVNLEEIMRMAQGAAGARPDAENLAQIARNAEGAYLEEEETPEPEIIVPEADKERASS